MSGARKGTMPDRVLAFLLARPLDYDASCAGLGEIAEGVNRTSVETIRALDELQERGLVEYHRPSAVPAYWRVTNKARRGER